METVVTAVVAVVLALHHLPLLIKATTHILQTTNQELEQLLPQIKRLLKLLSL